MNDFLPISKQDMQTRDWDRLDFLLISGDAYVDHPSFGPAIIGRLLESHGYRVGMIAQPNWQNTDDFKKLGRPRLAILVTAGNLDSMLNKYTAAKRSRSNDSYSPGGRAGLRPDRATIVYSNRAREAYKKTPIIIGGIEASLRRFAHFDYWSDSVRRSILVDSMADLLIFGMGETQIIDIAAQLAAGIAVSDIRGVQGTCFRTPSLDQLPKMCIHLPSYHEVSTDKERFANSFKIQYEEQDAIRGKVLVEQYDDGYVVQNPPALPLTSEKMDEIYDLPYQRDYHPVYRETGGVPALEEVKFGIVSHRGCFGACSFCAIVSHQGRMIQARSHQSIIKEAVTITGLPDFKGYIHDVGGPTANFRLPACSGERGMCKDKQCLYPQPCHNLKIDHTDYLQLLRSLRSLPKVKKVFIRSGIRYDYLLADKNEAFLREICQHHISGQLKVAPEHISDRVLHFMGKSGKTVYLRFMESFAKMNSQLGKEQYLVPYFISSHPGCGLKEAVELAEFLRDIRYTPEQVQDFIPTPGSLSTCMYYSERNPLTGEKLYVAKDYHDKQLQRALLQYRNPKNYPLVYQALMKVGRKDLIGFGPKCLIRPPQGYAERHTDKTSLHQRKLPASRTKKW